MRRLRPIFATLLVVLAMPVAVAHSSAYSQVLRAYEQKGSVPPCRFSSSQLENALRGVDTYGAQYFADFTAAIQTALTQRASGSCERGQGAGATSLARASGQAAPADSAGGLGALTSATNAGVPAPILLMALFAAAFGLIAATITLGRRRGWDPVWAAVWRHAWEEAGFRAGGIWAEFVDWLSAPSR